MKPVYVVKNFNLTTKTEEILSEALRECSPFLTPLSLPLFLELAYKAAKDDELLLHSAMAAKPVTLPDGKKTTVRLNAEIHDWIISTYEGSSNGSLSTFITWAANNWQVISTYCQVGRD